MLLRASGEIDGQAYGLEAVTCGDRDGASGVSQGPALTALAEALVQGDEVVLASARAAVLEALGPAGLVDAAAVASNFERMVRIADATGIPLDAPVAALTADLRDRLGLDRFASSEHTRRLGRVAQRGAAGLRTVARAALRWLGRRRRRKAGGSRALPQAGE